MTIRSWVRSLIARTPRPVRKATIRFRPSVEFLEERIVLNSYPAANIQDLINAITDSNSHPGANTITLTNNSWTFIGGVPISPYTLTAVSNSTDGATGLPVIAKGNNL